MNYDNFVNDQRNQKRIRFNSLVNYRVSAPQYLRVEFGDQDREAEALNLSEGGMALLTNCDIPVEGLLFLKFSLFKISDTGEFCSCNPIEIRAQVRTNIVYDNNHYRLGLFFVQAENEQGNPISAFLKKAG